jgi:ribonuclease HII
LAILGIDEVGRGPWAGPLVVGACLLPEKIDGLTDSKKLSIKKREQLAEEIRKHADFGLGWISAQELDQLGLTEALCKAARDAVAQIKGDFDEVIIDGTINFLRGTQYENISQVVPKADFLVPEVSAASIIAKVSRDHYMYELAEKYPGYGFEKHVGYGTAAHKKAIEELGICDEHRRSFKPIAQFAAKQAPKRKKAKKEVNPGARAEAIVAEALRRKNHTIIARNWKTKFCEIDIVSSFNNTVYFTEVKYRKSDKSGSPLEAIDKKKLEQMQFAAETFMGDAEKNATVDMDGELIAKKQPQLAVAAVAGVDFHFEDWFTLD